MDVGGLDPLRIGEPLLLRGIGRASRYFLMWSAWGSISKAIRAARHDASPDVRVSRSSRMWLYVVPVARDNAISQVRLQDA